MSEIIDKTSPQLKEGHTEADHIPIPSPRKLKANRENAKKSTGPRTPQGKAHSRKNAIKHGLFARLAIDFILRNENWSVYEELVDDLREYHKPVGRAEELEVEQIAQCWWKRMRANRYENAVMRVAIRDIARRELAEQLEYCDERDEADKNFILELQKLGHEIEAEDLAPKDLLDRLTAINPKFVPIWPSLEDSVKQFLTLDPHLGKLFEEATPEEQSRGLVVGTIAVATSFVTRLGQMRRVCATELAYDQHAIPDGKALDKLLRYEAGNDRNLNRALDRLERLQRARRENQLRRSKRGRLTRQP